MDIEIILQFLGIFTSTIFTYLIIFKRKFISLSLTAINNIDKEEFEDIVKYCWDIYNVCVEENRNPNMNEMRGLGILIYESITS